MPLAPRKVEHVKHAKLEILRNMFGGFDNNVYLCNILNYKYCNAYEND
jgi:hypothetical protein